MAHIELTSSTELARQLRAWGSAHAAARAAEQAAAQQADAADQELRRDALRLRERANRLHRDIYTGIGRSPQQHD